MNVRRPIAAVTLLGALVACNADDPQVPRENYALIFTDARELPGGGYVTLPVANFVNSQQLVFDFSTNPADACLEGAYDPTQEGSDLGQLTYLDPGDVTVAGGGAQRSLDLVVDAEDDSESWEITGGEGLPFTPGDTLTFTTTGATEGFPLFSIRARSAEAFTFTEPTVPAVGQPVLLNWTTTGVRPGSAMLVSLRYRTTTSGPLTRQIFCEMVDDGSFSVPAQFATFWRTSDSTATAMSRWRTEYKQVDDDSFAVVFSNFTVPVPSVDDEFRLMAAFNGLRTR
jgi:hypothetical protein